MVLSPSTRKFSTLEPLARTPAARSAFPRLFESENAPLAISTSGPTSLVEVAILWT